MRKSQRFHYISFRSSLFAAAVFVFLALEVIVQLILFWDGSVSFIHPLLFMLALVLGVLVYRHWIVIPYRDSEKWAQRFLDGYLISFPDDFDEVFLTPTTKQQIEAIDRLMKSPQLMDLNKRQAQYLALQNQINPHFLYNTLESIRGAALIAGLHSVADMTEALARFFRYTISKVENLVSVEEELDNCRTYFHIQKYRFGDRLELKVECEDEDREEIMNCRIPKLTLQPILENSIIHGAEMKIDTCNLKIQFERTEKRLIIRISDDGMGMSEEVLANLNHRLGREGNSVAYRDEDKKGGIALGNVNNRIHLIFGEEYGLHVYSVLNKGTDVEITLPVITREEDLKNRGVLS
ncbi:MAG: histidine kinase [Clostridiales bacterium]|nr:histidine kinase [Clostridiales bacterium]